MVFSWQIQSRRNEIENVTAQFGLQQIIKEPTRISNTSSSCTDLIFTSQSNLITGSGVHSSLHPSCHHQIFFPKLNLHIVHPPPHWREIWHYREASTGLNTSVNEKVFNRTILSILSNFIPHEVIVCNEKDLPWFNIIISSIQEKNANIRFIAITKIILIWYIVYNFKNA